MLNTRILSIFLGIGLLLLVYGCWAFNNGFTSQKTGKINGFLSYENIPTMEKYAVTTYVNPSAVSSNPKIVCEYSNLEGSLTIEDFYAPFGTSISEQETAIGLLERRIVSNNNGSIAFNIEPRYTGIHEIRLSLDYDPIQSVDIVVKVTYDRLEPDYGSVLLGFVVSVGGTALVAASVSLLISIVTYEKSASDQAVSSDNQ